MDAWFWVWIALAALLVAAEGLAGRLVLAPFAAGAIAAATVDLLGMGAAWQWAALGGVSFALTVVAGRLAQRIAPDGAR